MNIELVALTQNAEKVIEGAARTCYMSFDKEGPDSHKRLIRMLIKHGHESVLEHASATFRIKGGSRSFTHQLVRHRICSFSQQSQRYVNEKNFSIVEPDKIKNNKEAHEVFTKAIEECKNAYMKIQEFGIPNEDARFVLPNAVESEIVMSCNFREIRHICALRGKQAAQWEIRDMAIQMLNIMKKEVPSIFEDLVVEENIIKKIKLD
ncbi:MAG: FAD-dependent thymidylate synthase [bacterium]|nr:FAD-dependent thymidylate synthase [bacterium]